MILRLHARFSRFSRRPLPRHGRLQFVIQGDVRQGQGRAIGQHRQRLQRLLVSGVFGCPIRADRPDRVFRVGRGTIANDRTNVGR